MAALEEKTKSNVDAKQATSDAESSPAPEEIRRARVRAANKRVQYLLATCAAPDDRPPDPNLPQPLMKKQRVSESQKSPANDDEACQLLGTMAESDRVDMKLSYECSTVSCVVFSTHKKYVYLYDVESPIVRQPPGPTDLR